jgi:hypothetical protein
VAASGKVCRRDFGSADSAVAHADSLRLDSALDQVVARALRDGQKRRVAIQAGDPLLGGPHGGGDGPGHLEEGGLAEQVMAQREHRRRGVHGCVEGELVQTLDDHVEAAPARLSRAGPRGTRVVGRQAAQAPDAHAVDLVPRRRAGKARGRERDLEASRDEAAKDLAHVDLGAAGLGIAGVAFVENQDARRGRHSNQTRFLASLRWRTASIGRFTGSLRGAK